MARVKKKNAENYNMCAPKTNNTMHKVGSFWKSVGEKKGENSV
jgi:hypothetical protein